MPTNPNLLDILTGRKEIPPVKLEVTDETQKLIKSTALILAGSLTLIAFAIMSKRK